MSGNECIIANHVPSHTYLLTIFIEKEAKMSKSSEIFEKQMTNSLEERFMHPRDLSSNLSVDKDKLANTKSL